VAGNALGFGQTIADLDDVFDDPFAKQPDRFGVRGKYIIAPQAACTVLANIRSLATPRSFRCCRG
jgi:hypothetical protein